MAYVTHTVPDRRELGIVQGRDPSPDGVFRRRLFEILEAVEAQSAAGLLRVRGEDGRVLGQLIVRAGQVCFAMCDGPTKPRTLRRLRDVARSCRETNQPLTQLLTGVDASGIERLRAEAQHDVIESLAEMALAMEDREVSFDFATLDNGYDSRLAFAPATLMLEVTHAYATPCDADAASVVFDAWAASGRTSLLLRDADEASLLPYAVAGAGLDDASIRDVIRLTRSFAEALRESRPGAAPSYVVIVRPDLRWVCARGPRHLVGLARRLDEPVEPAIASVAALFRR